MTTMIFGCASAISRCRYAAHCVNSAAWGTRPWGGRHLVILVTTACANVACAPLSVPMRTAPTALSILSSSKPASPAKGVPLSSSSSSGGSPTTIHVASAPFGMATRVAFFRPAHKPQAWHWDAVSASASQSKVLIWLRSLDCPEAPGFMGVADAMGDALGTVRAG